MSSDQHKSKQELIAELNRLRQRNAALEQGAAERRPRASEQRFQDLATSIHEDMTERRQAEEKLKEREALGKETEAMAKVGGWELDVRTMEAYWTDQVYAIHELPIGQMPALREAIDFYHPEDRPKISAVVKAALERGQSYDIEARFVTAKGKPLWTRSIGKPVLQDGKVVKLRGAFQDITAFKQAEQALLESEVKYRALFENIQEAIFITDAQSRAIDFNQAACDLTGYTRAELSAMTSSDLAAAELMPLAFRPQGAEEHKRFIASGRLSGEYVLFRKNGVKLIAEYSALANYLSGRHVVIVRDITRRKKTEAARKENEARFARAFHSSAVSMALLSPGGHFLEVNDKACQLYGYSRQELLVMTFKDITHPDDLARSKRQYQKYLNSDQDSYELETRYLRQDGRVRWGLVTVSKVRDADDNVLYSVAQTLDLTLIKQAQAELIEAKEQAEVASRAKSEFLANMSHELRTPLNGVQGFLQLLEMSELAADQAESVRLAMESSRLLLRVINDILDFSKLEAERMDLVNEPFNLDAQLQSVMAAFAHQAAAKGLALQTRIAPEVPAILIADPARLRQLLFNLVGNAVKFTIRGEVRVEVDVGGKIDAERIRLRCAVVDTGIGIPADMVEHLFEPFTQVDTSLTRRFQGTGLGLSIVKRLVGLMGGEVEIDSTLGAGTQVRFTFLAGAEPSASELSPRDGARSDRDAPDRETADAPTRALHILVAEDEAVNAKLLERLLGKLGHWVQVAHNGREALALLARHPFDLVLMDIQMPEMDGVEATRQIRENPRGDLNPSIPIVALTAHALAGDREKYLGAGMDDYLSKPINAKALRALIDRIVSEKGG